MHRRETVERALQLSAAGVPTAAIGRRLDIARGTVKDWVAGRVPRSAAQPATCEGCGGPVHDFGTLPPADAYLLGLYLGDGCLSRHPRSVFRLRITLDARCPGIVQEARVAIQAALPAGRDAAIRHGPNCIEVYAYSKSWPCLFPQHGPGRKHERPIVLAPWQQQHVDRSPELLLRGLLHSDGCRFINTGRGGWAAPRYKFTNTSENILAIFCRACDAVGVAWRGPGREAVREQPRRSTSRASPMWPGSTSSSVPRRREPRIRPLPCRTSPRRYRLGD